MLRPHGQLSSLAYPFCLNSDQISINSETVRIASAHAPIASQNVRWKQGPTFGDPWWGEVMPGGASATPTPTPTATATPTATPTPAPIATATPTPSPLVIGARATLPSAHTTVLYNVSLEISGGR